MTDNETILKRWLVSGAGPTATGGGPRADVRVAGDIFGQHVLSGAALAAGPLQEFKVPAGGRLRAGPGVPVASLCPRPL